MLETDIYPDFIVVDGKEGGTGAAPLEFTDHLGMPMREGLNFVHNALIGINARDRIKLGAAGKIVSAFDIARVMALGADWCNSARGFMFALGCIQSLVLPHRPLPDRRRDPGPRAPARAGRPGQGRAGVQFPPRYDAGAGRLVAAAGLDHPTEFAPAHFSRRVSPHEVLTFAELYPTLSPGELLAGTPTSDLQRLGHGACRGVSRGSVAVTESRYKNRVGHISVRHMCDDGELSKPSPSFGCLKWRPTMSTKSSRLTVALGSNE